MLNHKDSFRDYLWGPIAGLYSSLAVFIILSLFSGNWRGFPGVILSAAICIPLQILYVRHLRRQRREYQAFLAHIHNHPITKPPVTGRQSPNTQITQ